MRNSTIITMTVIAMCLSCHRTGRTDIAVKQNDDKSNVTFAESKDTIAEGNGIYFWKSVFELNDWEIDFLHKHSITQLYIKMFDVSTDRDWNTGEIGVFPIATTRFITHKPDNVTIVPTVYITLDALKHSAGQEESLATKIVERVLAMVSFHNLGPVLTIQLDCDWTAGTRKSFFKLCNNVKRLLETHGIALSGTVRLHQLDGKSLPFDKSVLMLYNLGGLTDYDTRNSILDYAELEKYVHKKQLLYDMDFAYPTFSWGVWFRDRKFMALLHRSDFSNTKHFQLLDVNTYKVLEPISIEGHELHTGDVIRLETSDISEILKVKECVERMLGNHDHHNIIYHLDSVNLSNYTDNEIKNLYSL